MFLLISLTRNHSIETERDGSVSRIRLRLEYVTFFFDEIKQ